jgi:hypothetical protein
MKSFRKALPAIPRVACLLLVLLACSGRAGADEDATGAGPSDADGVAVDAVDLSGDELATVSVRPTSLEQKPWYEKIDVWGFGAFGFLDTGPDGTRPDGGFLVSEATLFVESDVSDVATVFVELQTNRLGDDRSKYVRTGEVYAHFRDVLGHWGENLLGIKVGRFDIPFGDEYLRQDASDNALVSFSAAYPYGWDEGVLLYGRARGVGWIAAVTDGTDERSVEDDPQKALNLKVYGQASPGLHLSASLMRNGPAAKSAIEFGGSHFQPVGASHASTLGQSASNHVDATLYEVDASYRLRLGSRIGLLRLALGQAFQTDDEPEYDRDFSWFSIEPVCHITPKIYAAVRFSEIGTYDDAAGYHFDGKTIAGGNSSYGYDAQRLRRVSFGLGWKPDAGTVFKLEVGRDWFDVIDAASGDPDDDGRNLIAMEIATSF